MISTIATDVAGTGNISDPDRQGTTDPYSFGIPPPGSRGSPFELKPVELPRDPSCTAPDCEICLDWFGGPVTRPKSPLDAANSAPYNRPTHERKVFI